jgi:hypothetical protein
MCPVINSSDVEQLYVMAGKPWGNLQGKERQHPGSDGFRHRYLLEGNIYSFFQVAYLILKFLGHHEIYLSMYSNWFIVKQFLNDGRRKALASRRHLPS